MHNITHILLILLITCCPWCCFAEACGCCETPVADTCSGCCDPISEHPDTPLPGDQDPPCQCICEGAVVADVYQVELARQSTLLPPPVDARHVSAAGPGYSDHRWIDAGRWLMFGRTLRHWNMSLTL